MFEKGSTVLFEIFNNLLSGIPLIIAIYFSSGDLTTALKDLGEINFVVLSGVTYLIGTVINAGSVLIQYITINRIYSIDNKSHKHVTLRKKDIDNWHYVEKWYMLSSSHLSLSLSLILSLILLLTSNFAIPTSLILLLIASIILLVIQSIRYSAWAKRDLENAYLKIDNNGQPN